MGERGPQKQDAHIQWLKHGGKRPSTVDRSLEGSQSGRRSPLPRPPDTLDDVGRKLWARLCRELRDSEMLMTTDLTQLEVLCNSYQVWVSAAQSVKADGVILKDGKGQARKHPGLQVMRDTASIIHKVCQEFGFSPRSARVLGLEVDSG